jgi:hypothetical protein
MESGRSEHILPHHAFDRLVGLAVVFGVLFLVVFDQDVAIYREIDELTYGHSLIYLNGLFDGDLECPVAAEADVAFAGGSVDIDAETAGRGFPFEEGDVGMGFRIFLRGAEVENVRIENKTFFRDLEIFDLIMFLCVEDMLTVCSQPFSEVNVIGIASQAASVVGFNFNGPFIDFFQDARIGQDHVEIG